MSTAPENRPNTSRTPLQSTLADDADMAELVQFFVQEMADRVQAIRNAAQQNDVAQLRTIAHQLKGAAGGYGFSPISQSAAELEALIDSANPGHELTSLRSQVDELIELCRRASM